MNYPPSPGAVPQLGLPPASAGKTSQRGIRLLQLGAVLLLVGIAGFVAGAVVGGNSLSKVDSFQRVPITPSLPPADVTQSVTFATAGSYVAYYEAPNADHLHSLPAVRLVMLSAAGKLLIISTRYGHQGNHELSPLTYRYDQHDGSALYEFRISAPDRYKVVAINPHLIAGSDIAFGKPIDTGTGVGSGLTVAGALFSLAAIVLLLVGFMKRRLHKNELANPTPPFPAGGSPSPGGYLPLAPSRDPPVLGYTPAPGDEPWPGQSIPPGT